MTYSTHKVPRIFSGLGLLCFFLPVWAASLTTLTNQPSMTDWAAPIWQKNGMGGLVTATAGNTCALIFNGTAIGNGAGNTRLRTPLSGGVQTFPGDSLTLNTNTELRLKSPGTFNFPGVNGSPGLILNGGMVNVGDSTVLPLAGTIQSAPGSVSYLCPGNNDIGGIDATRGLILLAQLSGSGRLVLLEAPTNTPQTISGNSNTFSGSWVVKSGWLLAAGTNALGTNSTIIVDPGYALSVSLTDNTVADQAVVEVASDFNSAGTLTLTNGGMMNLQHNCSFTAVTIDGVSLGSGTHLYSELTNRFAANFAGGGSGSLTVQPFGAATVPVIEAQPSPQSQFAGGSVIFTVAASADVGGLHYQWQKDATKLTDGENISGSASAILTINNVSEGDAGGYNVIVSNTVGSVTSTVVALTILTNIPGSGPTTEIEYLSGTDKDHTVPWNFIVSSGLNAGIATNIPVPSCWESTGFGTYQYGNYGSISNGETGTYTCTVSVPPGWAGKEIFLVFEGAFTDTSATINGHLVGATHQGGFYEFKYDATTNVVVGATTNVLQVVVRRWSTNASIVAAEEKGDFWDFGGIYRPVYLEAKPGAYIDRIASNPQASGQIGVDVFLGGIYTNYTVNAFVTDSNNTPLGGVFSAPVSAGTSNVTLSALLPTPNPWSAEYPTLYTLTVQLVDVNSVIVHTVTNLIGFRTLTFVNGQGFFVNGKKVVLRGICHHEEWPTTGRTSSLGQSDLDLALIRDMNFNTIRMTHYPPNKVFLNECDRLGFYVLDELTGWEAAYDNATAVRLVKEFVVRDVNHPCILAWDNGNEGGWNTTVDNDGPGSTNVYAIWDPQQRKVLRPQSTFNNIVDDHYPTYSGFSNNLGAAETAYMCTEVLHGLYDGGGGASLQEYWDAMRTAPNGIGMFLWVFADSGQVRSDEGGTMDVKGQSAPDGIMGPYREKEASYYAYKAIYNPVQVGAPDLFSFAGTLLVSNRYDFTSLNQCSFDWQLGMYPDAADPAAGYSTNALTGGLLIGVDSGSFAGPALAPQSTGFLNLPLFPAGWTNYDALRLTATDPFGNNLYTWTWPLRTSTQIRDRIEGTLSEGESSIFGYTNGLEIIVTNGTSEFHFSEASGVINSLKVAGRLVSLSNGPRPVDGSTWPVTSVTNYFDGTNYIILVNDITRATNGFQWAIEPDGWAKLTYRYTMTGMQNFMGVTFDYPANQVTTMSWLGQGPYRVYKNRLAGQEVFTHTKAYNYTWTGQSTNYAFTVGLPTTTQWDYPEFEGYHGRFYWATLQTTELPVTVATTATNLFFRLLTPPSTDQSNVNPPYPPGTISFLDGISPMGDKFHLPVNQGPAGQMNAAAGIYTGEVDIHFGALATLPAAPVGIEASAGSAGVILSWEPVPGATGYNLKSSTNNGGAYTIIASNITVSTFTNGGLRSGQSYFFVVSAINAIGEGKNSKQASAIPALPAPAPVFREIIQDGTNLFIAGTNGTVGVNYRLLATTNLGLPLANWIVMATSAFGLGGGFTFTNPISPSNSKQFYILKMP